MQSPVIGTSSAKASEIVRLKLANNGGKAIVTSINGKSYEIRAHVDGKSFLCDQLDLKPPYEFRVFDVIVDVLLRQGGKAQKGNGRNFKLGESHCNDTTVVGSIGKNYFGRSAGESVFDPVFVLAAVLDWAGIVHNRRGYLELTDSYRALWRVNDSVS